jgi:hypothetical protein
MAYRGHLNLLEHAFTKLNQEQLAILLSQQTRNGRNSVSNVLFYHPFESETRF